MTKYRVYFEPVDIEADNPDEVEKVYKFNRLQPDILRCIVAEDNLWDHVE